MSSKAKYAITNRREDLENDDNHKKWKALTEKPKGEPIPEKEKGQSIQAKLNENLKVKDLGNTKKEQVKKGVPKKEGKCSQPKGIEIKYSKIIKEMIMK